MKAFFKATTWVVATIVLIMIWYFGIEQDLYRCVDKKSGWRGDTWAQGSSYICPNGTEYEYLDRGLF
jgi:hypothetical protein